MLRSEFRSSRIAGVVFAAFCVLACEPDGDGRRLETDASSEGGTLPPPGCARPAEGCECAAGTAPVECHLDAVIGEGVVECRRGTRSCRSGSWSPCEDVHSYTVSFDKTLGTPSTCSLCSPDCQTQTTTPDQADVTSNGGNVLYNGGRPGIVVDVDPPVGGGAPDNDGDGVPDATGVDECLGQPGFRAPCDGTNTVTQDGLFFSLPRGSSASGSYPPIELRLRSADLYIMMDTTGSMAEELSNLQSNLTSGTLPQGMACAAGMGTGLLGALRCTIPDIQFGVGMTREYPNRSVGDNFLVPYAPLLDSTSNFALAQSVINSFTTMGNQEGWPEATGQALYSLASGRGLSRWLPNRGPCPNGGVGYACFRTSAVPIVMVITDAPMRHSPNGGNYNARYTVGAANLPPALTTDVSGTRSIRQGESFATALDLGDMTNRSVTVEGSTHDMNNDHTAGCPGGGAGSDFVARFTLTQSRSITIRTEGSDYDGMLYLYNNNTTPGLIECDDDDGGILDGNGNTVYTNSSGYGASVITRTLAAGTYNVVADGYYNTSDGAVQLRIFNNDVPASSTATPAVPIAWSSVTGALSDIAAKTVGIATCPTCSLTTYATCRTNEAAIPAACTAEYNNCSTATGGNTTNCLPVRTACVNSFAGEAAMPSSCSGTATPKSRACAAGRAVCPLTSARCTTMEAACNLATDPCATSSATYCTCQNAGSGDAFNLCPATLADLRAIGTATNSLDSSGRPFVYTANPNGSGLSNTVADAIIELAQYLSFDVDVVCIDNPATAINECTTFNVSIVPSATPSACPSTCVGGRSGNSCLECAPGSNLRFTVNASNTSINPTTSYQIYNFEVMARADARIELSRIPIRIVVPPTAMGMQETGTFTMKYDSSTRCRVPPQRPDWGNFAYTQDVPTGTSMQFEYRTADTEAGLLTATPVTVSFPGTPTPANPLDIGNLLVANGQFNSRIWLQFRARLTTNADGSVSPALRSFTLDYTCADAE